MDSVAHRAYVEGVSELVAVAQGPPPDIAEGGVVFELPECDPGAMLRLQRELGLDSLVAQTLVRRGVADPADARRFIEGCEPHSWRELEGAEVLAERVMHHVANGGKIVVHGDYDVDGVSSTAILTRTIERVGGDVTWHVPSRFDDGYGLSAEALDRFYLRGAAFVIAVDCGITSVEEVVHAKSLGLEMAICDHHVPRGGFDGPLPDCTIVHPALGGYPFGSLCAAAVSYKLAQAIFEQAGLDPAIADQELDLVALATVCDVMPLEDENRALVKRGLAHMWRTSRPGLRALLASAGVDPLKIDSSTLGFRLGPRINAAGRMFSAEPAVELMLTDDQERAAVLARELESANHERREIEQRILAEAQALAQIQQDRFAIVVAAERWHAGVLGIVAGKLAERFRRPAIATALVDGVASGSGRTAAGFDLLGGLRDCEDLLSRFGGHRAAVGLEFAEADLAEFTNRFQAAAAKALGPSDLRRRVTVDAVADVSQMTLDSAKALADLAPFGEQNREPVVLLPGVRISGLRKIGETNDHIRCTIEGACARVGGVAFRCGGELPGNPGEINNLLVRLQQNEWRGGVEAQLLIEHAEAVVPVAQAVANPFGEPTGGEPADWLREFVAELEQPAPAPLDSDMPWWLDAGERAVFDHRSLPLLPLVAALARGGSSLAVVVDSDCPVASSVSCAVAALTASEVPVIDLGEACREARNWTCLVLAEPIADQLQARQLMRGAGSLHLAWGSAELTAARARVDRRFDLRCEVADLYRVVRDRQTIAAADLPEACRTARSGGLQARSAARALRVLDELELVRISRSDRGVQVEHASSERTSLDRSQTFQAYSALREVALKCLSSQEGL